MKSLSDLRRTRAGRAALAVISALPVAAALALVIYYILGPGEGYFHSDCTDSIVWANATVESGKIFDPDFKYAALLPFSASAWMVPLIRIFGYGMTAHNIAMIIFAVIFAASVWFCFRSFGMGRGFCGIATFAVLMLLSSSDKLREIMWGHVIYYSIGLCVLFFALGIAARLLDGGTSRRRYVLLIVLLALLSAGAATDGMQIIAIAILPTAAALIAERIFCGKDKLVSEASVPSLSALIAVVGGTAVGMLLLELMKNGVSAGYADAYSGWSSPTEWVGNAQLFFRHFMTLMGLNVVERDSLFAVASFGNMIRIGISLVILAAPLVMLVLYRRLSTVGACLCVWAHLVLSAVIIFGFICGKLSAANWRLTPIAGSAVLVTLVGAYELWLAGRRALSAPAGNADGAAGTDKTGETDAAASGRVAARAGALLTAFVMLASLLPAATIAAMPADYGSDNNLHRIIDFCRAHELEYGYATFWNGPAVTVLSDSDVTVRQINVDRVKGIYPYYYQSDLDWYADTSHDRYFVILTASEAATAASSQTWQDLCSTYLTECYDGSDRDDEGNPTEGIPGFRIYVFSENILASTDWKEYYGVK